MVQKVMILLLGTLMKNRLGTYARRVWEGCPRERGSDLLWGPHGDLAFYWNEEYPGKHG